MSHLPLDTPIFHKVYDLYKLFHSYHNRIPKSERYTLWQKCETTSLVLLEVLIETNRKKGDERVESLSIMSDKLDLLKVLVRLSKETRAIDSKQYIEIQAILQEIGKMIGGWIKTLKPVPHPI